jgi:hypothetical protein
MEKVLKKYTTIPEHLYVNRSADTQLKRIIEEMQRPGYVLVARQMGKTNLLFNAKRTLENSTRLFAYVDLSNLYKDEKDCYRNIINNIIEPNFQTFSVIDSEIEKIRNKQLPPHNEYLRCLTAILNVFPGDLVVILDEIDALKSVNYSDNIFAQIRSNYFSRTNYPTLERLTYVLSGVIEPTELIKDKNKSPFNIGDKIYLDDFSKEEHNTFIKKSKLPISTEISEEIYNWTHGNPRLTFDLATEVENYLINNGSIEIREISNLVKTKYLTTYDIAPIDHIRELVKTNRDVRKALTNLRKGNSAELSDDIKRKLYLFGIISSNFSEDIRVKNRIIDLSLTEDWIKSIDKENTYVSGLAAYSEKNYSEAIDVLSIAIESLSAPKEIDGCNYFIGLSHLKLNNYDKAIKYFSTEFTDEEFRLDAEAFLGVCQIAVGDKNAISTLEKATSKERNTHAYHSALLNLAINIPDKEKSFSLLESLYNSTFESAYTDQKELSQLRCVSLYYQAEILEKRGDKKNASAKVEEALKNSIPSDSIYLLFYKSYLLGTNDVLIKKELVDRIVANKLKFTEGENYPITFSEVHIYYYLSWVFDKENLELFEKLLEYTRGNLLPFNNKFEIVLSASRTSEAAKKDLLDYILLRAKEVDNITLTDAYREYLFVHNRVPSKFIGGFHEYVELLRAQESITPNDIYLFAIGIKHASDRFNFKEGLDLCNFISSRIENIENENLKFESLVIYYWYSNLYTSLGDSQNAIKYADITLAKIKGSNGRKMSLIDEKGLKSIEEQMNHIKSPSEAKKPFLSHKTYSRNEKVKVKYNDGSIVEKKYKHIQADLMGGKCKIV